MTANTPRPQDCFASRKQPLKASQCAILVIDAQNWVFDKSAHAERDEFYADCAAFVIPNIARLLAYARTHGVEVIYTVIENQTKNGRDRSLDYKLSNFFVAKGSAGAKVIDVLRPQDDELVIAKTSSSLFNSTNFEYLLRNIGIGTVMVTGFLTDQCVDHSIRDGADRGFHMICISDAVASDTRERHRRAIAAFGGYCRVENTDSLLKAMQQDFALP